MYAGRAKEGVVVVTEGTAGSSTRFRRVPRLKAARNDKSKKSEL